MIRIFCTTSVFSSNHWVPCFPPNVAKEQIIALPRRGNIVFKEEPQGMGTVPVSLTVWYINNAYEKT
jgi:hypothetical protein